MIVHSKGNDVEIAPGVKFVERNHSIGPVYFEVALTEPTIGFIMIDGKNHKQIKWTAKNIETGEIIEYGMTEDYEHYSPTLFQSFEDSEDYWNPGKLGIQTKP